MATIDIRDTDNIDKIVFSDDGYIDSIKAHEFDINAPNADSHDEAYITVRFDEIDDLIRALEKLKEIRA